jgi:hypothetical protein
MRRDTKMILLIIILHNVMLLEMVLKFNLVNLWLNENFDAKHKA